MIFDSSVLIHIPLPHPTHSYPLIQVQVLLSCYIDEGHMTSCYIDIGHMTSAKCSMNTNLHFYLSALLHHNGGVFGINIFNNC